MTVVSIPFMERFKEPMLNGTKTWTSRTKKYGKAGDYFVAFGRTFQIHKVSIKPLQEVVQHFKEEGLVSEEEARKVWASLHPVKGFVSTQLVFVHEFELVQTEKCEGGQERNERRV